MISVVRRCDRRARAVPAVGEIENVYAPIGLGSGIRGVIGMRDALRLRTRIVGVVAEGANTYARSVAESRSVPTTSAFTFADGIAVRVPDAVVVMTSMTWLLRIVGSSNSTHIQGTRVPVEEPSTASIADIASSAGLNLQLWPRVHCKPLGRRIPLSANSPLTDQRGGRSTWTVAAGQLGSGVRGMSSSRYS